jgi:hypothetical protein
MDQAADSARADGVFKGEVFEAIGFEVVDEESYNLLAEYTENSGEHSLIYRGDAALHGRCWKLGQGLEVWSVLYETPTETYYADCRPSYRSRYVHTLQPWELSEYDEDGEAIIRGRVSTGSEVIFELQNLTEINQREFRNPRLQVALAGLASDVYAHAGQPDLGIRGGLNRRAPGHRFVQSSTQPVKGEESCETDYEICGTVLAYRKLRNSVTESDLLWLYLDATTIRLEVLASLRALAGNPMVGDTVSAKIWLQGHILEETDILARYEGVDHEYLKSDFWSTLKRGN